MEGTFLPVPFLRSNRIFSARSILLYPDKTIVQTLPGSSVPYTLNKYKEELGKPFSKLYFWVVQDLGHPKLYPPEEGSESSEPGQSNLSDTATTAYSEANERDGSSRISSCQVKTSASTNGAITKTS